MLILAILVFFLTAIVDILWILYLKYAADRKAIKGGFYGMMIYLAAGINIISYTTHWLLLVPAAAGAFMGTSLAIKFQAKQEIIGGYRRSHEKIRAICQRLFVSKNTSSNKT